MTKAQEIEAITLFAEKLPNDTYLKPWLRQIIPQIEADIRNDFPVHTLNMKETREHCAEIERECIRRTTELNREAVEKARIITETASRRCEETVNKALRYAREAVRQLEIA